jgi:hypothetical protein
VLEAGNFFCTKFTFSKKSWDMLSHMATFSTPKHISMRRFFTHSSFMEAFASMASLMSFGILRKRSLFYMVKTSTIEFAMME